MPFSIIYAVIPAQCRIYRDIWLEEDYTVLLCLISQMLAAGVHATETIPFDIRSGLQFVASFPFSFQRMVQERCEEGFFQLKSLSPSRAMWFQIYRLMAMIGLARLPEKPQMEIVLPPWSSSSDGLFDAVKQGDSERVQALLNAEVNVDAKNEYGQTVLTVAATHYQEEIVMMLLRHRADVNTCSASGWTALMSAGMVGNEAILTLLLSKGASINATALTCQTALRVAAIHGHDSSVRLLISKGAILDPVEDPMHYTTLMFACTKCSPETLELLIAKGANVNVMALDRMTPLRCAEADGRNDLVSLLRTHGATV